MKQQIEKYICKPVNYSTRMKQVETEIKKQFRSVFWNIFYRVKRYPFLEIKPKNVKKQIILTGSICKAKFISFLM